MANAVYSQSSVYYSTTSFDGKFLDLLTYRDIPRSATDLLVPIGVTYNLRPDLLAFDLYGNSNLWWVFAVRNPNTLIDPIWSFKAGTKIYLPQKQNLIKALGV